MGDGGRQPIGVDGVHDPRELRQQVGRGRVNGLAGIVEAVQPLASENRSSMACSATGIAPMTSRLVRISDPTALTSSRAPATMG